MAYSEMTWRKLPRNIMTDPQMDYVSSCLPHEYQSAPYMFYMVALSVADDDGIFDLEDGIIFARLMHIGTPELVMQIANLFLRRKIITRAGTSSKCMLTNWEYSIKEKGRTLEQRREVVRRQIEEERRVQSTEFNTLDEDAEEIIPIDFTANHGEENIFFGSLNDKNPENVAKNIYDDKTEKNVVKKNETEKIREDKNREIEKTHTEKKDKNVREEALRANCEALRRETIQDNQDQQDNTQDYQEWENAVTPEEIESPGSQAINEEEDFRLVTVFDNFFTKNCLGYSLDESINVIKQLIRRIITLSDDKNPPEIIASCLLSQFKKLTEDPGYYQGTPLEPEELIKPGMYKHALAAVSRILVTQKSKATPEWIRQLESEKQEITHEKAVVGNAFDDQYLNYNIDPNDPNRALKLMRAQNTPGANNSP